VVFKVSFNYLDIYTIPNNNTKDFKMRRKKKKSKIVKLVMLKILTSFEVLFQSWEAKIT